MARVCGTCRTCVTDFELVSGGPFGFVDDTELRRRLMEGYGLCMDDPSGPIVVPLRRVGPCEGTCWEPRWTR